jgi:hypothetical protein
MEGMVLYCWHVVHAVPSALGAAESDWVRRAGVLIAMIGTAVAAPEGTALIWRAINAALRKTTRKIRAFLARYLPFLRRNATVNPITGEGSIHIPTPSIRAGGLTWKLSESVEEKVERLREQLVR